MFRETRRGKQALSCTEIMEILKNGTSGVLAVAGDDDYPYAVPISYVYFNGKLYFHCAKVGHKMDAIARNPKASFCVIGQDKVSPTEYTTHYRSVIAFGRISIIEDDVQKLWAIRELADKYAPNEAETHREKAIANEWSGLCMLEMSIEHMTGKEARELKTLREKER